MSLFLDRRRRSAGLHHFFEHLQAGPSNGLIPGNGKVGQLVVMRHMTCIRVPVLIRHPFIFRDIGVARPHVSSLELFRRKAGATWIAHDS